MLKIELTPSLDHCVESTAKDEYDKSVREYLRSGEASKELEERIELLKSFLESMDFSELRQASEKHLIEGRQVRFVVFAEGGQPKYEMWVTEKS
jgi:hypothetical protein